MNNKTCSSMMIAGVAALLLMSATANAEGGPQDMKFAANCKPEGAEASKCTEARRELVKYSMHCKMEGEDGKRCQQAGEVVKSRKLAEQPDVTGEAPTASKAMPAAAAAPVAAKDELDLKYAMHCKAEGAEGAKCIDMRDKVGKYAASCKQEGADGERCQTAHKVVEALSGK